MNHNYLKIRSQLLLKLDNREKIHSNFNKEEAYYLKKLFAFIHKSLVLERSKEYKLSNNDKTLLLSVFNWSILSPDFKGDLQKGLWLCSPQGVGKDLILKTIVAFYAEFGKKIREFTFSEFNKKWFNLNPEYFKMPIKINDVNEMGMIKLDRTSFPIVEFLDYREINNNRRGLLVSSNFTPKILQNKLEKNLNNPRLEERAKECFNVIVLSDSKSKRSNDIIKI
jgi:hypothetical protein